MTAYETAFEIELGKLLAEWAEKHEGDGRAARAAFAEKIESESGWSFQGAFGYALSWDQGHTVAAETRSYVAKMIQNYLAPNEDRDAITPTVVVAELRKDLNRMVAEGIDARSTSETSNLVARQIASAALGMLRDSSWDSLEMFEARAADLAVRSIAESYVDCVNLWNRRLREAKAHLATRKAESTKVKAQQEVDRIADNLAIAERARDLELARLGAPVK